MSKKLKTVFLYTALSVLMVLLAVSLFINSRYTLLGGQLLPLESTQLDLQNRQLTSVSGLRRCGKLTSVDLRGNELSSEDIRSLRSALPQCSIRWDIPLGKERLDSETDVITVTDLDMSNWQNLALFGKLRELYITDCKDFERLAQLQTELGQCEIHYCVELGGESINGDTLLLNLPGGTDFDELKEKLSRFPAVGLVRMNECSYSPAQRRELCQQYPDIRFVWPVEICGQSVQSTASALRFAPETLSGVQELLDTLDLFPRLREVDISGCTFSAEELETLCAAFPDVHFLWTCSVLGVPVSSDDKELDLSGIQMGDTSEVEAALPYLPRLEKVIMSECGFTDEQMDELNNKYEDVRFVWTVHFGLFHLRTDATSFIAANFQEFSVLYNKNVECLKYCTDLIALDLGHMEITDLSFLYYMPHMKYLIVAECPISDITPLTACKELSYLEIFKAPLENMDALLECKALRDLNICYIWAKTQYAYDLLSQLTWLDRLWYCGNWFDEPMQKALQEALPNCEMDLRWGAESTGGTWRKHEHYYEMRDALGMYYMPGGTNGVDENGNPIINAG